MQPTPACWPKWHQLDDSIRSYPFPFLTLLQLSAHNQWSGKQDWLWLYQREDKNRSSLWIISHEKKRGETRCQCPQEMWASLNSIRTKQPRRCRLTYSDSMPCVWALQEKAANSYLICTHEKETHFKSINLKMCRFWIYKECQLTHISSAVDPIHHSNNNALDHPATQRSRHKTT